MVIFAAADSAVVTKDSSLQFLQRYRNTFFGTPAAAVKRLGESPSEAVPVASGKPQATHLR
ncbi:hypothetical protein [Arthrobacter nitrophenolicus]|jgi:hypothetical protein|uniref:hypothetical protein n=1 Tax=Arthrobacter nitrophenolicus TaxID=683150 RepID=UPI00190F3DB9|nr:hypothetical protein [Arthrobacter nitrophenolicus]